jgi:hypothetical protein
MFHRLIYRSLVARQVRLDDVDQIAVISAKNNAKVGVTGLLLYTPSHFVQVLEGEKSAIGEVLLRVRKDPRHSLLTTLAETVAPQRAFGEWAMTATMPNGTFSVESLEKLDAERALQLLLDHRPPT